jgi:hypothetical protein
MPRIRSGENSSRPKPYRRIQVCMTVKARSEEGGGDGVGKSGIADCDYDVDFVRTPGTTFEVYER